MNDRFCNRCGLAFLATAWACIALAAAAQEGAAAGDLAQANNPFAKFTARSSSEVMNMNDMGERNPEKST